ncbi:MAG: nitrous oxide reductase family maturation protein NosD, partial [Magnetospirillum sp.]
MRLSIKNLSSSTIGALASLVAAGLVAVAVSAAPPAEEPLMDSSLLQALIDIAQPGQVIVPPPGRYRAHLVVSKPVILDGQGKVTLDGEGRDSVLWVKTDGATVRNLRIVNSGIGHPNQDAGIQVRGSDNVIEDNIIENTLFGFAVEQSNRNIIRRNSYTGKRLEMQRRGDGIKLWYSHNNRIESNDFHGGRDVVFWYANGNVFKGNREFGGRYGLHLMQAADNIAE